MAPHITAVRGDITREPADAIINAANEQLMGGGGVDGAIHRVAGPKLIEACRELPVIGVNMMRCRTGDSQVTPAFNLPAMYVIHTVGPVYDKHPDPHGALASAYRSALGRAVAVGARTVASPAVSCGVYGFPIEQAASIAIDVVLSKEWDLDEVRFVLFNTETYDAWQRALNPS